MVITLISDTHNKHSRVTHDLPGGELLLHAGDSTSMGYEHELENFFNWYKNIPGYEHKVFIAGNHDWGFQDNAEKIQEMLEKYPEIDYLEDNMYVVGEDYSTAIKIWGSPWQPEFYNWAFNLPRNGDELKEKWDMIPDDIDILITHGPAWGFLDDVEGRRGQHLGCELLAERIKQIKPKIHVCGHIHWAYGQKNFFGVEFLNAAVLNERYVHENKPISLEFDVNEKKIIEYYEK